MTTYNNALLYNAALNGYLSGAMVGANLTDATSSDYGKIVTQAQAWAAEIDSLILTDTAGAPQPAGSTGISVITTGVAITPTTSTAVYESQLQKTGLIQMLSMGIAFQRYATGLAGTTFATQAAAVKALYFEAVASASTP